MNIVICGSSARVYGEDVQTCKSLLVGTYDVCFNQMSGFSLCRRNDLYPNEEKIYGSHPKKVEKVMKTFKAVNRNLGVILSGRKGSGKSLFVRILSQEVLSNGMPVIIVSGCYPGISDFISSIEQEVLVVFDEFEKVFGHTDDEHDPQNELLPLFDGIDNGKKLFVITCNDTNLLNDCLLNRPGRFHYHFDVKNPTEDDIREYMTDNLLPEYADAIESIVRLSILTDVTYDFLRAISFELNQGYSLAETMQDLNISDDKYSTFDVELVFKNGRTFRRYDCDSVDFNRADKAHIARVYMYDASQNIGDYHVELKLSEGDVEVRNGVLTLSPDKLKGFVFSHAEEIADEREDALAKSGWYSAQNVRSITFKRSNFGSIERYAI